MFGEVQTAQSVIAAAAHLHEVAKSLSVTGGLSENILNAGVRQNLLGCGTSNETSSLTDM